ncbi:MAG: hypothetical protein IPK16_04220 [Anaerolineales bacterium]|nr:hypothetical protein [Anaerolineales bacterium]
MSRTFVGFGFGAIQAGLFLTEAFRSHQFERLVVVEIVPEVVNAVAQANAFTINIGFADHIESLTVGPVEIYRPQAPSARQLIVDAIVEASEMATAVPSVDHYTTGGADAIAALLAEGLVRKAAGEGPVAVIYTAENNTRAAEILEDAVLALAPGAAHAGILRRVQFLDTIIGKMSGAPAESADLAPIAPGFNRTFLVESFNRILITQVQRPAGGAMSASLDPAWDTFARGLETFVEKPDLAPFADAKLYGHNAGHALAGYLAHSLGFVRIDQLTARPDILTLVTDAMSNESGAALCHRYAGVDPLFTPAGFHAYAADLVTRMVNPYVRDTVARVGRDPVRKLGWQDRLIGAMRVSLDVGGEPWRYALGAAAAIDWLEIPGAETADFLNQLWLPEEPDAERRNQVSSLIFPA